MIFSTPDVNYCSVSTSFPDLALSEDLSELECLKPIPGELNFKHRNLQQISTKTLSVQTILNKTHHPQLSQSLFAFPGDAQPILGVHDSPIILIRRSILLQGDQPFLSAYKELLQLRHNLYYLIRKYIAENNSVTIKSVEYPLAEYRGPGVWFRYPNPKQFYASDCSQYMQMGDCLIIYLDEKP